MSGLIITFFAAWATASILVLIPGVGPWLRRHDLLGLVPEWKFFAPIPGRGDFHLLYRDWFAEVATDWTEIVVGGERRWWNFLWHPRRRERKATFDAARELPHFLAPERRATAALSVPYITLLTYVSGHPRTLRPDKTQFLLMYSEAALDEGEPQVSLLSFRHDLDD